MIELAEAGLGLTGNGIPTGTMGKLTQFELDKGELRGRMSKNMLGVWAPYQATLVNIEKTLPQVVCSRWNQK